MKKQEKITLGVFLSIALIAGGVGGYAYYRSYMKSLISLSFQKDLIIEYGDNKVSSKSLIVKQNADSITYPKLDTKKVGKQSLQYIAKYKGQSKNFTINVEVKDRKKPEITFKHDSLMIHQGDSFDSKENIQEVKDPINGGLSYSEKLKEGSYTISSSLDTETVGTYEVKIEAKDKNGNLSEKTFEIIVEEKVKEIQEPKNPVQIPSQAENENTAPVAQTIEPTYINGILLVNKNHPVAQDFGGGDGTASAALGELQAGASAAGFAMPLLSGYRSYDTQTALYNNYVAQDGQAAADRYSARPGTSEHQMGLAFDIGAINNNYGNTPDGQWLNAHAHEYGFILRYPQGKEGVTGYMYEPWHVRYLGVDVASAIYNSGLTLEEYLGVY